MSTSDVLIRALAISPLVAGAVTNAKADMLVLESNLPDRYQVRSWIPDSNKLSLPPCGRVKVLLTTNETRVFTGPNCPMPENPNVGGTRSLPNSTKGDK